MVVAAELLRLGYGQVLLVPVRLTAAEERELLLLAQRLALLAPLVMAGDEKLTLGATKSTVYG